jgi:uncharacterized membrane protein
MQPSTRISVLHDDIDFSSLPHPQPTGTSEVNVGENERIVSAVGGLLLLSNGLSHLNVSSLWKVLSGGYLLYRGLSGNCLVNTLTGRNSATKSIEPLQITRTVVIGKPRHEVFAFWRKLENLPKFMHHLSHVVETDEKHSHWKAPVPGNLGNIEWDAEIVSEQHNEHIAWRSVANATVDNGGEVIFREVPEGTEVQTTILYRPPAGEVGKLVSAWLSPAFKTMIYQDLLRFKNLMESGDAELVERS